MRLEESNRVIHQSLVMVVQCLLEGELGRQHGVEDHTERENVGFLAVVALLCAHFRCYVSLSATVGLEQLLLAMLAYGFSA